LRADYADLKQQLEWLKRQLFGRKSEKRLEVDPAVRVLPAAVRDPLTTD